MLLNPETKTVDFKPFFLGLLERNAAIRSYFRVAEFVAQKGVKTKIIQKVIEVNL